MYNNINFESDLSTIQFRLTFKGHISPEYCCLVMNLASVSTISYADSNDGIFLLVGSLGCIKPEIVGLWSHSVTLSKRLLNLPAKRKFRERARNFYRKWKHLVRNKLLRCQTWHGHRNFATGDRSQLTLRLAI